MHPPIASVASTVTSIFEYFMMIPLIWLTKGGDYASRPADSVRWQTQWGISARFERRRAR
jgi:hypothetical protein